MTAHLSRRRRALAAGGALALALLAGCSADVPQPKPEPTAATPPPVLDEARTDRVLEEIGTTIAAADEAKDGEALAARVTGPALAIRRAEYALAQATGGRTAPAPITTASQVEAVATTRDFPREAMVITQVPEGANLPLLLVLAQESPREQYKLWGWVELFPGTETPALINPETGSAQLPPDAEGLVATPKQVIERYVDTLNNPSSEFAGQFAEDPYKTSSAKTIADLNAGIAAAGNATVTAAVGDDGPVCLSTADGGAIVVSEVTSATTLRKTVPGATLTAGGAIASLLGSDTEVRGTVTGTADVLVAFYVPPAGGENTTIQVLGATKPVYVSVARDDAAAPQ
ncbi:hypothetical protein [Georgenia sp. SYP-B2076]|uniref:hypothetical protein n=1 Tax=Georgenia sp. SYP-B2076 TaxID=2495881 RepID=UPI000F8DC9FF|nr:hypothetical protein [Georgenia sp. SYP-B2076]